MNTPTLTTNPSDPAKAVDGFGDTADISNHWRVGKLLTWSPVMGMWLDQDRAITIKPGQSLHEIEQASRGLDGPVWQRYRDGYRRVICVD